MGSLKWKEFLQTAVLGYIFIFVQMGINTKFLVCV